MSFVSSAAAPAGAALHQTVRVLRRGQPEPWRNVAPGRTLLSVLRDDLRLTDTKEGCASGDCGACTVVLADLDQGALRLRTVNSCIRPAHAAHGRALFTAADLAGPNGRLHPVQQALLDHHGSQCGFCTPGIVMSLLALYERLTPGQVVTREMALQALSGNLCRCTGYRPIVEAAMSLRADPAHCVNTPALRRQLKALAAAAAQDEVALPPSGGQAPFYLRPTLPETALQARARHPQATLIAGATDAGLWLTQGLKDLPHIIDLGRVRAWQRVETYAHHLAIGAAVPLQDAFDALARHWPGVHAFGERFAGWPVRQSGTLVGNVANGSPIGDSMPMLIAMGAQVVLMAWRRGRVQHRHLPLEDFYTGYRQTQLAPDELVAWVVVPKPRPGQRLHLDKLSKRQEDDISAVCLALRLTLVDGQVQDARVGVGGVAATPLRAHAAEAALRGQPWNPATALAAGQALAQSVQPISDMRASADYRRQMLRALMQRAQARDAIGEVQDLMQVLPSTGEAA